MNFENYKFRCSQLGSLMTNGRDKTEKLGATVKGYLLECYISAKYNRRRELQTKYMDKGLFVEEDSITLYSEFKGEFFRKNEDKIANDFIQGTPDIIHDGNLVIDIKSSWDIFTFFKSLREENKDYIWQLHGYMWLTGINNATLAYCLVDTPDHIIQSELKKALYQSGLSDQSPQWTEYATEITKGMRFEDIPIQERVIEKHYTYDPAMTEQLKVRIADCREYLNNLG